MEDTLENRMVEQYKIILDYCIKICEIMKSSSNSSDETDSLCKHILK